MKKNTLWTGTMPGIKRALMPFAKQILAGINWEAGKEDKQRRPFNPPEKKAGPVVEKIERIQKRARPLD